MSYPPANHNFCSPADIVFLNRTLWLLAPQSKVLVAQSVLELSPIVTHRGHPLTFCHPCVTVNLPAIARPKASSDSNLLSTSGVRILLELRCAFQGLNSISNGKPREENIHHVGNEPMVAPRTARPHSSPNVQQGGALCIQVRRRMGQRIAGCIYCSAAVFFTTDLLLLRPEYKMMVLAVLYVGFCAAPT